MIWLTRQLQAGQRLFAASIVRILCFLRHSITSSTTLNVERPRQVEDRLLNIRSSSSPLLSRSVSRPLEEDVLTVTSVLSRRSFLFL